MCLGESKPRWWARSDRVGCRSCVDVKEENPVMKGKQEAILSTVIYTSNLGKGERFQKNRKTIGGHSSFCERV